MDANVYHCIAEDDFEAMNKCTSHCSPLKRRRSGKCSLKSMSTRTFAKEKD